MGATACAVLAQGTVFAAESGTAAVPTRAVHATKADLAPGRLYSSPALAVDPKNPLRIVGGFADLRTRRCGLMRSVDGGRHMGAARGVPGLPTYPFCSQSQGGVIQAPVAFGGNGMLYMALERLGRPGGGPHRRRRSWWPVPPTSATPGRRSSSATPGGRPAKRAENIRPVQSIAVDSKGGDDDIVYVTFGPHRPGLTAPNAASNPDGGSIPRRRSYLRQPVNLADKVFESRPLRDQALAAAPPPRRAPDAPTTTTTIPAAGSKAATPNQAANFGSAGSRNGMRGPGRQPRATPTSCGLRAPPTSRRPRRRHGPVEVHRRRQDVERRHRDPLQLRERDRRARRRLSAVRAPRGAAHRLRPRTPGPR